MLKIMIKKRCGGMIIINGSDWQFSLLLRKHFGEIIQTFFPEVRYKVNIDLNLRSQ